jgi:hypothetical protein
MPIGISINFGTSLTSSNPEGSCPKKTDCIAFKSVASESTGKYDIYTGGENIGRTSIGGIDLFWGLRHELRKYFGFLQGAHSGIVNDYVLWVVGTLAVLSVYLLIVL